MSYLNEKYKIKLEYFRKLSPEKVRQFEEIPTLDFRHYELFLSQEFMIWFNNYINRAIDYITNNEWPFYGTDLDVDNKSLALLEAVLLNYFNDLDRPIEPKGDSLGFSLNRDFYLKYQGILFRLVSTIYFNNNMYNVYYDLTKGDLDYCKEKQLSIVNLDMLQNYILERYNNEENMNLIRIKNI